VMVSFSESSEHVRATKAATDVLLVIVGLLGRTPTAAEVTAGRTVPVADLIELVRRSPEYAHRVR
jgi:hypothetical protein